MKFSSLLCIALVMFTFGGCSFTPSDPASPDPRGKDREVFDISLMHGEIREEVFDGDRLSLVLAVTPEVLVYSAHAFVELSVYGGGVLLSEESFSLAQLLSKDTFREFGEDAFPIGTSTELLLQHDMPGEATDYQLRFFWHREEEVPLGELLVSYEVRPLPMVCQEVCSVPYQVDLVLTNPFPQPVGKITFSAWFGAAGSDAPPQERGVFSLGDLVLTSGETRQLSIHFGTPLPYQLYEMGHRPQLELESFEFQEKPQYPDGLGK